MINESSVEYSKLLTRREVGVARLMGYGRTNKEIALELQLTVGTVKNYTSRIIHKLEATNRVEAAVKLFMSDIYTSD
ncbi:MAG: LuxR C-terminal-related transcriptional regulator [Nitrosomonadaceae bacterium]